MSQNTGHPNMFPAMHYENAPAAIDWLQRVLGFSSHMVVPGEDGLIAHAELAYEGGMVMLGSATKVDPNNPWAKVPMGLYVRVDDIDAHYARAQAGGAEIVMTLHDTPYGSREYTLRDPGGHLWAFGTYDPFKPQAGS